MIFRETQLAGVFEISIEPKYDERGFFARTWCRQEFESNGIDPSLVQCSISFNHTRGTLRGMHYQANPHPECKLVRCTRGAIYDVVIDLRQGSPTFGQWTAAELSADVGNMLYIPGNCAHGFITLEDRCEILYQISEFYHPDLARGLRWNDPAFRIDWPMQPAVISERDRDYPDFREAL